MKIPPMQMPQVQSCDMTDCDYNKRKRCHAIAVTIGDGESPKCDTYWIAKGDKGKAGDPTQIGHVGACHMSQCLYNDRLECGAAGIMVGINEQDTAPMCLTYHY